MIDTLIDSIALILECREPPSDESLTVLVEAQAKTIEMSRGVSYTKEQIQEAIRAIKESYTTKMDLGSIFEADDYAPWLAQKQGDIDWYFWKRYKKHLLTTKKFPPKIVHTLDQTTFDVLDRLEDPTKEGPWHRRGLVVGHVQSGKTANYTGLICRAADAGYKVIIILAGLLNSLRSQTQERIDSDFLGFCTRHDEDIGVSRFSHIKRKPISLTSSVRDFSKHTANTVRMPMGSIKEPIVLVTKKNKSSLEALKNWLIQNNKHNLNDYSMLLVDDEADHASINTRNSDKDPTAINKGIRELLSIFNRSSLVGYTATPFANIFIDPDNEHEMENGEKYKDLFPRDFILSLDPPSNYIGPNRLFTTSADLDCIRDINDNEDILPVKHKIDYDVTILPNSLHQAIESFILAKAIRLCRGQGGKHYSMMVNASRFTRIQEQLQEKIKNKIDEFRQAIGNYAMLPSNEALKNQQINQLHETWKKEYKDVGITWCEVLKNLKKSIDPTEVMAVNSTGVSLDYDQRSYPHGRTVIAVGGLGLSRGLTLEGLLVSYFLRNSIMYDTLMQMGRWFGYRDGYEDICRIYMSDEASSWYTHIANATEELRADFRRMARLKLTPLEFGLRVRSHPAALIVTARNKGKSAKKVPHQISLRGQLIETTAITANKKLRLENEETTMRLIEALSTDLKCSYTRQSIGHQWENVKFDHLITFIEQYKSHPESYATFHSRALVDYLELIRDDHESCIILLRTLKPKTTDGALPFGIGLTGELQERSSAIVKKDCVSFKNGRLGSISDEEAGLDKSVVKKVRKKYKDENKSVNPRDYRELEGRKPLLVLQLIKLPNSKGVGVGFSLCFPGDPIGKKDDKDHRVEYLVNTTYWNQTYMDFKQDAEEEEE